MEDVNCIVNADQEAQKLQELVKKPTGRWGL